VYKRVFSVAAIVSGLFAIQPSSADDPPPITKKDIKASKDNLKQIVLGFHNYHDSNSNKLPSDILDKDGKPLLSWRVAILPFIEEKKLYEEFKLDEPWDSVHNKKLIEKMPKIYAPVRVKAKAGETFYQTMTGEGTIFVNHKPSYNLGNIPDGTSNTGLVYEAGDPVIWSKPADLLFDEKKPVPKLGGIFDGECLVGMGDGSVRHLRKDRDEQQMKYLIMPADGNVINIAVLEY
jgi:hypothetical protein